MTEYFETGTEPTTTCDVHYSGWVCLIDGLPATEECPFKYSGILELIPVEADVLASGSTILNPDGTVTTPSMTNMCQHTPEFYALPEASILIQQQWDSLTPEYKQIPIFTQSGDNRYDNADKMIMKGADVMPHALINNVATKLGEDCEILVEYIKWLAERISKLAPSADYEPIIHIDVYGTMGMAYGVNNYEAMANALERMA